MKAVFWVVLWLWFTPVHSAGPSSLPFPANLQKHAAPAVVVLFSLPDCSYCEKVRQQSLRHLDKDPSYKEKVLVYEVDFLNDHRKIIWFNGQNYTGKSLATLLNVKFSPTVIVFASTGDAAGKPLLGASLPDFYNAYLGELIQKAWVDSALVTQ